MPKRSVNVEQDPHSDGDRDGIISDPVGKEIGIRTAPNNSTNPFHVKSLKKDPELEKFNQSLE
ncbi:hypothetical protein [Aquibacillus saliphilus]|uniref:hypothetical protein n=1 Tax=Aquibacillus saliphilus TaxID=1909422 RepID=UPI001CF0183C|nr:hypothetical protein [Aquibacillus saliphilus]